jgi:hypothetical protein
MKLLPQEYIEIRLMDDGIHVLASLYEHQGARWWNKYHLSDLPNDLISLDDLKRFGINSIDKSTCGS